MKTISGKVTLPNPIIAIGEIHFNKPLVVEYFYVPKTEILYYTWDFGMEESINSNSLFLGIYKMEKIEDKVRAICCYDLSHAFFHYDGDSNYSEKHWALRGWYRDKVKLKK